MKNRKRIFTATATESDLIIRKMRKYYNDQKYRRNRANKKAAREYSKFYRQEHMRKVKRSQFVNECQELCSKTTTRN